MKLSVFSQILREPDTRTAEEALASLILSGRLGIEIEHWMRDQSETEAEAEAEAEFRLAGLTLESLGRRGLLSWGEFERSVVAEIKRRYRIPTTSVVELDWGVAPKFDFFRMSQRLKEAAATRLNSAPR